MAERGKYLYGIVTASSNTSLGNIGLDGSEVYCVHYKDIAAIIHDCEATAYSSDNREIVKKWIVSHERVVESAWDQYGVIVPVAFDTIIKGDEENLKSYLAENYDFFVSLLTKFAKKAEYGVEIFWDVKNISEEILKGNNELISLQKSIQSAQEGTAYLYKKRLEQTLKIKLSEKSSSLFDLLYDKIKTIVDDVIVEKPKETKGDKEMIMNILLLSDKESEKMVGSFLDEIEKEGYGVRFTGPWPPYSFARKFNF